MRQTARWGGALAALLYGGTAAAQPWTVTNSVGMEFVYIQPGSFLMGTACPAEGPLAEKNEHGECMIGVGRDETPRHRVTISRGFYLGKYELDSAGFSRLFMLHAQSVGAPSPAFA